MRLPAVTLLVSAFLFAALPGFASDTTDAMLSYQGFTGILNTPNAHVSREGNLHLLYTDQHESIWRSDPRKKQSNYLLAVGLFDFVELGGRLTDVPGREIRDLSASFKITSAPFTKEWPYLPAVAFGIQDMGGGSNKLRSTYVAASGDLWRFRFSAGYGFDSDRMKGGFGGVEFKAHDWVTLLGEYDTKDTSAGIRLTTPELWITPIQLTTTVKSTLNHSPGSLDVGAGLVVPLDFKKRTVVPPKKESAVAPPVAPPAKTDNTVISGQAQSGATAAARIKQEATSTPAASGGTTNTVTSESLENLRVLRQQLESAGFIRVRVGQRQTQELVVEYENTIFNHNELDALGIVAGIVAETAREEYGQFHLVIKRKGLRVAALSVPGSMMRAYMRGLSDVNDLKSSLKFSYSTGVVDDAYFLPDTPGFRFPDTSLIIAPGLQTFISEAGLFDYLFSFRPEILSTLWNGGVMQLRWDVPVAWSDNFDDGRAFRGVRKNPRMDRAMLFQGINLAPGLMANIGGGMVLSDTYGTLNEITWSPFEGAHRFRGLQALARDVDARRTIEVYLGSYRYKYAPLDLSLEVTGGKFWGQDRGVSLELKRFFGDTAVSAVYKNSTTSEGKHWQAAGIQFAFPLTPAKDLKIGPVAVRGADEWAYAQESTLAVGGQKTNNVLSQSLAINPQPTPALYRSYYNRDRLDGGYVAEHLDRLREVWMQRKGSYFH